jgi:hypothetical protein
MGGELGGAGMFFYNQDRADWVISQTGGNIFGPKNNAVPAPDPQDLRSYVDNNAAITSVRKRPGPRTSTYIVALDNHTIPMVPGETPPTQAVNDFEPYPFRLGHTRGDWPNPPYSDTAGAFGYGMDVGEVLVFDRNLTDDEENRVGWYLTNKWDMPRSEYVDPANNKTLTINVSPAEAFNIYPGIGAIPEPDGKVVSLVALQTVICPNIYVFDHWEGDVANTGSATTSIVMDADKTITAVYVATKACGDACHPIPEHDFNGDCITDLTDFADFYGDWLSCTQPDVCD